MQTVWQNLFQSLTSGLPALRLLANFMLTQKRSPIPKASRYAYAARHCSGKGHVYYCRSQLGYYYWRECDMRVLRADVLRQVLPKQLQHCAWAPEVAVLQRPAVKRQEVGNRIEWAVV